MERKALVVGIGNRIRQDDSIGHYCVELLLKKLGPEKKELVDCLSVHQLDVVFCDLFAQYPLIIFLDADARDGKEPFLLEEVFPEPVSSPFTSHIGSIPDILSLTQRLYGVRPQAYITAVRGENFEIGEEISRTAAHNACKAVERVCRLISEFFPLH